MKPRSDAPPPGILRSEATRESLTRRAAQLSLASNIFLVVVKVAAGLVSGSISVLAEGVQSTLDVLASGLILYTVRAASEPPDSKHPYGHGKLENLASQAQMFLILGSSVYLFHTAWERWKEPRPIAVDWGLAALMVAIVCNFLVSRHLHRVARQTGSHALKAEATHLQSDLLACVGVGAGLVLVWITGEERLDPLVAAVMTVIIVVTALKVLRDTVRPLLDESLPSEEDAIIRKVLENDERILGFHRLRTRRAGSYRLMDVHIMLDDNLTFSQAHAISEDVEEVLRQALPNVDVIVHAEPYEEEIKHQHRDHPEFFQWHDQNT